MRGDVTQVGGDYALHADGTISYLVGGIDGAPAFATTVPGEHGVTQVAAQFGLWGLLDTGQGYALHADGTLTHLVGLTSSPVGGLGTVTSLATRHDALAYVTTADGQVYFIDGTTPHVVLGATNVATVVAEDVPTWNTSDGLSPGWDATMYALDASTLDAAGWAITKDGSVLRLQNMVAEQVPSLTGVTSVVALEQTPTTALAMTSAGAVIALTSSVNYDSNGIPYLAFQQTTLGIPTATSFVGGEDFVESQTQFVRTAGGDVWGVSVVDGTTWAIADVGVSNAQQVQADQNNLYVVHTDGTLNAYRFTLAWWTTPSSLQVTPSYQISNVRTVVAHGNAYIVMADGTVLYNNQMTVGFGDNQGWHAQTGVRTIFCTWQSPCVANLS